MFIYIVILFSIFESASTKSKGAFAVYQIIPRSDAQVKILSELYENTDEMRNAARRIDERIEFARTRQQKSVPPVITSPLKLDFWRAPSSVNNSVDVMVYPEMKENFTEWLYDNNFHYETVINDLALLILKREIPRRFNFRNGLFNDRRLKDDRSSISGMLPMGEYYSYDEIVEWMRKLERLHPNFVRLTSIGTTHERRNIYGLIIGAKRSSEARIVWIDAGIHAREWASVHTALYFIQQLVSGYERDPKITEYINALNIYIFPCLNPDGYEYTRTDQRDPAIRMWRKNMSPEKCFTKNGKKRCCKGVDLNRNFAFRFAEVGSSSSPCSEIHHGDNAFSEPESRAVRDAVLSLSTRIDAFITLHTYSQLWIYPFSHKKYAYSADVNDLKAVAKKAVESLQKLYGTQYRYGTGPEIIYPYAGGSADWAKESARVKYSYTIELRPSYFDWNGFILDKRQLVPTGRETLEGVKVVIDKVIEEDKKRRGIETPCFDVSSACSHWISSNPSICQTAEKAMEKQCQKSCSFC